MAIVDDLFIEKFKNGDSVWQLINNYQAVSDF